MSKLVIAQIYVDPDDWRKLEDKVGKRNRSAFIRKVIADQVAEPETEIEIEAELSAVGKRFDQLSEKRDRLIEKRESAFKQLEEKGQTINNAEELIDSILEQNEGFKKIRDENRDINDQIIKIRETHITEDELRSIAKKFNQRYSDLKLYVENKENAKIWKSSNVILESGQSDPTKQQQFNAEKS